jgi:DNA-binding NtrC family response regulator
MGNSSTILLVEDNLLVSTAVQDMLGDKGYSVHAVENGKDAEKFLKNNSCSMVLLDMMLPDTSGQKLLEKWRKTYPELVVVIMTAHGDIPTAVECLRAGAFDFLTKPVEEAVLIKTIDHGLNHSNMVKKVDVLSKLSSGECNYSQLTEVVATSSAMTQAYDMLKVVAQSDYSCVLITGESGTGKGLLARRLHKIGKRGDKPFVEINCSALPENLIESELFGHKKGAFTDAKEDKIGLFEMADGGTLFLDEIGDMDVKLQAKLLKVMEEQTFRRIGGTEDIKVDVTIIAATNQDLEKHVQDNQFRSDLYYRLNVIPVKLPPLRERPEDIKPLADHFIKFFARKFGKNIKGVSDEVFKVLCDYDWPGNVREFRNVIERSCILSNGEVIDNPAILFPGAPAALSAPRVNIGADGGISIPAMPLADAEKIVIQAAMTDAGGNKNKAASILGLHRTTLYKKLEEYQIS